MGSGEIPHILTPKLSQNVIYEVIENGYISKLSFERRFDQTLYFIMYQK